MNETEKKQTHNYLP